MFAVSPAELRLVALTEGEYERIVELLGREPNQVELGVFGAMWSEHCSYKTSRALLRRLPTSGARVLQGPGENAGAVEIGDGLAVVFKVESHNHPSAIEPHQGAATGVGGILRDVFAMGARPVALLDSLRFGLPDSPRNRHLFAGVVAGIGDYGNCIGVPTVGGEIYFDDCYSGNPLVNAMCVGIVRTQDLRRAAAQGPGSLLLLAGADTGRDGIHGATFASVELDETSGERRPAVQVGNAFLEKCLLEATLELAKEPWVEAVQDLGAAGLTSSTVEVASRGGVGVELDVDAIPRRERAMSAYEVMLSESQERMLFIIRPGHEAQARDILDRWGLHCAVIGRTTGDGRLRVTEGGALAADIPVHLLTEAVPARHPESRPPDNLERLRSLDPGALPTGPEPQQALLDLLASPNLCSRRSVYRRYDHMVGDNTVVAPGGDAAVLRVKPSRIGLAVTTDGNSRYCHLDPRAGGAIAVAEAARNVVATGARPLAVTDCLNFGNPDRAEIYWQLEQCIDGISEACRALEVPVVSGNVSLYNEASGENIHPTPVIGMVGVLSDVTQAVGAGFRTPGDFVVLVGATRDELGGSEYLKRFYNLVAGAPPALDLAEERRAHALVLEAIGQGLVTSAHDVSDGGLLVALAECCILGGMGARCGHPALDGLSLAGFLFGESQSRFVLGVPSRAMPEMMNLGRRHLVPVQMLGVVGGEHLVLESVLNLSLEELRFAWERSPVAVSAGDR
jgi:phosphoribosylformylglycinamidine synthase